MVRRLNAERTKSMQEIVCGYSVRTVLFSVILSFIQLANGSEELN